MFLALAVLLVAAGASTSASGASCARPPRSARSSSRSPSSFALALGAGSVALYLAATPAVYEETELWGAALALAAVGAIVAVLERPTVARVLWAGAAGHAGGQHARLRRARADRRPRPR